MGESAEQKSCAEYGRALAAGCSTPKAVAEFLNIREELAKRGLTILYNLDVIEQPQRGIFAPKDG